MSSTLKGKKLHIPHTVMDAVLGAIIRRKPVRAISEAAGRSDETVKKWRIGVLPEAFSALVNLIAADDEVYRAVMELAGRDQNGDLSAEQRDALAEILNTLGVK